MFRPHFSIACGKFLNCDLNDNNVIGKISLTSPIVINVSTRALLAVETKSLLFVWLEHLNNKSNVCKRIYYIDTDEIPGFLLLLKNHIFTARSERIIFIFHM